MKRMRKALWIAFAAAAMFVLYMAGASAAPALQMEQAFTQQDQIFYGTTYGDERFHYVKAEDGAILTNGEDGLWYYAGTNDRYLLDTPSNLVSEEDWVAQQEALHPASDYSALLQDFSGDGSMELGYTGEQNLLVLLVDFKDYPIQHGDQWADLVFGSGNSVKNYYLDATSGGISFVPAAETQGTSNDGITRVSLNYNHPGDTNNEAISRDAIKAAASYVNFAAYDKNNDRRITSDELHILVVCGGYEGAYGDYSPSVWGHHNTGGLTYYGAIAGGKTFTTYTQIGERQGDHMATIGIICHELGHDLGLPDLYGSGTSTTAGLGGHSLMASGSWGYKPGEYSGTTPVYFDAYCLEQLGLFNVQTLQNGKTYNGAVKSLSTGNKNILRVNVPNSSEYFLIENRQLEGYDSGMQRYLLSSAKGGVAVYRINPNYSNNYYDNKQLVTLLEADASIVGYSKLQRGEYQNITDPYFYIDTNNSSRSVILNRNSQPSTLLQGGGSGWFTFECKSEPDASMNIAIVPIFTVSPDSIALDYRRGTAKITPSNVTGTVKYESKNTGLVTVDKNGNVKVVDKRGAKGATSIVVSDESGFKETVTVKVSYNWWQWIIVIVLFGWIWY